MPIPALQAKLNEVRNDRQELRNGINYEGNLLLYLATETLTALAMQHARLNQTTTPTQVTTNWNQYHDFFFNHASDMIDTLGEDAVRDLLKNRDDGRSLGNAFIKHIRGMDKIPEGTPPSMYPRAGNRILALRKRMNNNEFTTPEAKKNALAEILAARKLVVVAENGLLSYDSALNTQLDPRVNTLAQQMRSRLDTLSPATVDRLFEMAQGSTLNNRFGGDMEAEFDRVSVTPLQREITGLQTLSRENNNNEERLYDVAAELIWLHQHWGDTQQQRDNARSTGARANEVKAIRESGAFQIFVSGYNHAQLANLIEGPDPAGQDPLAKLGEGYGKAELEYQAQVAPYEELYNGLVNDYDKAKALRDRLTALVENQQLQAQMDRHDDGDPSSQFFNAMGGLAGFLGQLTAQQERARDINQLEDEEEEEEGVSKEDLIEGLSKLKSYMAWYRQEKPKGYQQLCQEYPEVANVARDIELPEAGTAGNYQLSIQAGIMALGPNGAAGFEQPALRLMAIHEQAGYEPGWENKKLDMNLLEQRVDQLQAEIRELNFDPFGDLTSEEAYRMLRRTGDGKELAQFYQDQKTQQAEAGQQEANRQANQTVEDRLQELLQFSKRQALYQQKNVDPRDVRIAVTDTLAIRALARDYQAHPEQFQTLEQLDARYQDHYQAYGNFYYTIHNTARVITEDPTDLDGEKTEEFFQEAVAGDPWIRKYKNLQPQFVPTVRQQIEGLQVVARDDLKNPDMIPEENMYKSIAQIIGLRQYLDVSANVWGGDARMDVPLPLNDAALDHVDRVQKELEKLSTEQLLELYRVSTAGHGGKLMEAYEETMAEYAVNLDEMPTDLPKNRWPLAEERIEVLQEKIRHTDDPQKKLHFTAEIIAARQVVGARKGGFHLDEYLDPAKCAQQTADVEDYLKSMTPAVTNALVTRALDGHGGNMLEDYKAQNTYANQIEAIKDVFSSGGVEMDVAKAWAIYIHGGDDPAKPVDEGQVAKTAAQIRAQKGYETFVQVPAVRRYLANGQPDQLAAVLQSHAEMARQQELEAEINSSFGDMGGLVLDDSIIQGQRQSEGGERQSEGQQHGLEERDEPLA